MAEGLDALFAMAVNRADEKIKNSNATDVVCRSCPYDHSCCDSLVGITKIEALILAKHIEARPDRWQIIRRLKERYELVRKAYNAAAKLPDGTIVSEYFSYHVKCALYLDGKCSAYDVRPMPCREAYTAPGDDCYKTSTLVDTGAQDMLINVAQKAGLDSSNLGYAEMSTALLEILTQKKVREYFVKAIVAETKRASDAKRARVR